jgi:N-methylhydantoinase A
VLAAREVARELGRRNVITMDMGGTSCDVSLIWDDQLRLREQVDIDWGIPARVRTLDVQTVGAGGGSIAWQDPGGALRIGPRSAGAVPGPACYGGGGTEPTVTDANLALGILSPAGLLGGGLPLSEDAALAALERVGKQFDVSALEVARAIHTTVSANMAQAIREVTVQRGIDPRDCVLVAFGGAGPQHATAVAAELEITDVIVPRNASVLSAVGLLTANLEVTAARTVLRPVEFLDTPEAEQVFVRLGDSTRERLAGALSGDVTVTRYGGLRYTGQSHEIGMELAADAASTIARFGEEHRRLFGSQLDAPVEIVDLWVTLTAMQQRREAVFGDVASDAASEPRAANQGLRDVPLAGDAIPTHARASMREPQPGPCLIEETNSMTYVPPGAHAEIRHGHLVITLSA